MCLICSTNYLNATKYCDNKVLQQQSTATTKYCDLMEVALLYSYTRKLLRQETTAILPKSQYFVVAVICCIKVSNMYNIYMTIYDYIINFPSTVKTLIFAGN